MPIVRWRKSESSVGKLLYVLSSSATAPESAASAVLEVLFTQIIFILPPCVDYSVSDISSIGRYVIKINLFVLGQIPLT